MTPPEPAIDAPTDPSVDDPQNTAQGPQATALRTVSDTDAALPSLSEHAENTTTTLSASDPPELDALPVPGVPAVPADRHAARLKRPTHPGRPIHAPGASGLLEAADVPIPKPPSHPASRPVSRPAQRPTSLLGSPPTSRPVPRPTDPLAPASAGPAAVQQSTALPAAAPAPITRPSTPRRDTPTALSGPLSAPPGTSPLSPTRPDAPLTPPPPPLSTRPTRPMRNDPLLTPNPSAAIAAISSRTAPPRTQQSPRPYIAAVLLLALLLPTATHPPWLHLDQPAGSTALALAGLLLLPGLTAGPPHLIRWALRLGVAATLAALTALALTDTHVHPPWGDALDPLHGSLSVLGLSLLLGAALAQSAPTSNTPARIAALTGAALLIVAALVPGPSGTPLLRLLAVFTAADATTADTAAALATLAFAALALTTALIRALSEERRMALALVTWLLALAPIILYTALSTPPAAWMDTFAPLKASLAFAGALLWCADAIAPALEPEPPAPF